MLLVIAFCLATSGECQEDRIPLIVPVTPAGCFAKAQEVVAERAKLWEGWKVSRFGCERRSNPN